MTDPTPHSDPQPRPVRRTDGVRVSAPEDASPERATVPDSVRAKAAALKPRRRFGGTEAQIRGALTFYKVCAWISGTFLLLPRWSPATGWGTTSLPAAPTR